MIDYICTDIHTSILYIVLFILGWVKFSGTTHNRASLYMTRTYTYPWHLTSSLAFTSAPFANKCAATSTSPFSAAKIRAVLPNYKNIYKDEKPYFNCNFAVTSRSQYSCNVKWPTDSQNTFNLLLERYT